jgi:ribosomal protein S18 acetylase RimI-like enzyme
MTVDESIQIQRLRTSHIRSLSVLHAELLGGQLTRLGHAYIRYFYEIALSLDGTFGWIALENGALVGFVFGGTSAAGNLPERIVRKDPARWALEATQSMLLHPLSSLKVAKDVLRGTAPGLEPNQAELHFIAVKPELHGRHIGQRLLIQFCRELVARGGTFFKLSVSQANAEAIRFYERNGGESSGDYERRKNAPFHI